MTLQAWHLCVRRTGGQKSYHCIVETPEEAVLWLNGAAAVQSDDENVEWNAQGLECRNKPSEEWEEWYDHEGRDITQYRIGLKL